MIKGFLERALSAFKIKNETQDSFGPDLPQNEGSRHIIGCVLSGGGSRSAYQAGALKAILEEYPELETEIRILVGSSIGAVNAISIAGTYDKGLKHSISVLESIWRERTFKNTFLGSPSRAFLNTIKVAFLQYSNPGPKKFDLSIFDPTPLVQRIDDIISLHGYAKGIELSKMNSKLEALAVMTTVEDMERKALLIVNFKNAQCEERINISKSNFLVQKIDQIKAIHGFASAALPSVLPPVSIDLDNRNMRLVDGGIADNVPIDPAMRLGATGVISIDSSGRQWWQEQLGEPKDRHPSWELRAKEESYCIFPDNHLEIINKKAFGPILKYAVGQSMNDFIKALGPTWPIFKILKHKLGEELAYETLSYVALHSDYIDELISLGYQEAKDYIQKNKRFKV